MVVVAGGIGSGWVGGCAGFWGDAREWFAGRVGDRGSWVVFWRKKKRDFLIDDGCGYEVDDRFSITMFVGCWWVYLEAVFSFRGTR